MDVMLVSGREHNGHGDLARALVARGHQVRWLRGDPGPEGECAGVEVLRVPGKVPSFRQVLSRLVETRLEIVLAGSVRARLPDVVHVLGFGGASSAATPWIARRLGAPVAIDVEAARALCHRNTLVDETGAACRAWNDAARCETCCLTPWAGGLTRGGAFLGRRLRFLGGLSPFPAHPQFQNRLELVFTGLLAADLVLCASEADAALLEMAGVPRRTMRVVPVERRTAEEWESLYEVARGRVRDEPSVNSEGSASWQTPR